MSGKGRPGGFAGSRVRALAYGCLLLALAVNIYARATRSDSGLLYALGLALALAAAALFIVRIVALDRRRRR